jgi:DNA-binding transcriptional LysR family regulator
VRLRVQSQFVDQLHGLAEGEIDFVLNLEFSALSAEFESETLYTDSPVILASLRHPLRKKRWVPDDLLRYPRVALRIADTDKFMMFQTRGQPLLSHRWPAAYETDNLIVALATVATTDALLPAGDLLTGLATRELPFKPLPSTHTPPFKLAYCLVSHRRLRNSAPHQWLKHTIRRVFRSLHA